MKFKPGFRISAFDAVILIVASILIFGVISISKEIAFIIGYSTGHFFLFCNVFRISRKSELVWAGVFVALSACNILADIPGWVMVITLTLIVTIIVIGLEMRKKSYCGILWKMINPEIINSAKAATLIDNIIYSKTDKTYSDEIFTVNNFKGALNENILEVKKHIYDYLKTDSKTERAFAEDLESGEVAVYAKLPNGFKIPTPVGNYNPDWAVVFDTDRFKYVYFIAETKGSMESLQLKEIEKRKINYAKKHFDALGHADIKYDVITTYQDLRDKVMR